MLLKIIGIIVSATEKMFGGGGDREDRRVSGHLRKGRF